MGKITIVFGILLIALGIVGYVGTGSAHPTALIPAYFGAALALLGAVAISKPSLNMHVMHGAVLLGLIGFLGTVKAVFTLLSGSADTDVAKNAAQAKSVMAGLMLVYVILCVRSFIAARKARKAAAAV